jgi:hypothetical protein
VESGRRLLASGLVCTEKTAADNESVTSAGRIKHRKNKRDEVNLMLMLLRAERVASFMFAV